MTFPISRKIAVVSDCEVILAVQRNENLCTRKSFSIMRGVSWEDRCLSGRQPPHKNNAMRCDNAYAREITGRAAAARPVRRIRECAENCAKRISAPFQLCEFRPLRAGKILLRHKLFYLAAERSSTARRIFLSRSRISSPPAGIFTRMRIYFHALENFFSSA